MTPSTGRRARFQRGVALLALLALLGVGTLYYALTGLSTTPISQARNRLTQDALAKAKGALIARAATDGNRPGSLPCPDRVTNIPANNVPGDGIADMLAGNDCPAYIGRLPWRTLGLEKLVDGHGETLWYALSPSLRDDDSAEPINADTVLTLSLDGKAGLAALVFAPGPPTASQTGRSNHNPADYLDGSNADSDLFFASGLQGPDFNDRVLAISRDELFRPVQSRVAGEVRKTLAEYYSTHHYFPYANPWGYSKGLAGCAKELRQGELPLESCNEDIPAFDTLPNWFSRNRWETLIYYALSKACSPAHPNCSGSGYLSVGSNAQAKAALVAVGGPIAEAPFPAAKGAAQVRPSLILWDYLDSVDNADGNDIFSLTFPSASENDQISIVP